MPGLMGRFERISSVVAGFDRALGVVRSLLLAVGLNECRRSFVSLDVAGGFIRYLIGPFGGDTSELVAYHRLFERDWVPR